MVAPSVCVTVVFAVAAFLAAVVDAQYNNAFNQPGGPNFNGPSLAARMGQLTPSIGLSGADDTDFQGMPCSVDIHFGTRAEYNCFCAQTAGSAATDFFCDRANQGRVLNTGTNGVRIGASNGYGALLSGVEVSFEEDCYVKDVNVRLRITSPNATEVSSTIEIRTWNEDLAKVDSAVIGGVGFASIRLGIGQAKVTTAATDTCADYRLAAFYTSGVAAQNRAQLNIDAAYDDKIGLYCNPHPLLGGDGNCTDAMVTYIEAYENAIAGDGIWSHPGSVDVSGIPQFCPPNKGQAYASNPGSVSNAAFGSWYISTDEYKDASAEVTVASDLLATNTLTPVGADLHQTGAPDAGTGKGLNVFDGFIFAAGRSYNPCYENLIPVDSDPPASDYAFFLALNDIRQNVWCDPNGQNCGTEADLNMWCVDVLCETLPPSPTPTTTIVIVGDPHFSGFHGEKYDVMAEPGEVFNILSDSDVQLNALFIGGSAAVGLDRTYIGEYGLKFNDHHIRIAASGRVFVDDVLLPVGSEEQTFDVDVTNEVSVSTKALRNGNIHVTCVLPSYSFTFGVINSKNVMHAGAPAHVNLHMGVRSNDVRPHGLLGQTILPPSERAAQRTHNDEKEGGDVIEGTYTQYKIADNSLFGDDFKYNQFGKQAAAHKRDVDSPSLVNLSAFLG